MYHFHPEQNVLGIIRNNDVILPLETKIGVELTKVLREGKAFLWSREDTLLLISQYREHEKLFRDVNYKKRVWELITIRLTTENPNFGARPEQIEGKWKTLTLAFRKCCDHNIFREMFKRNVLSTGKSRAIIPQTE